MNRLITTIMCLLCVVCSQAQTDKDEARQIIDIQLNTDYLFAEANGKDDLVAYEIAMSELLLQVNKVRSDRGKGIVEVIGDLTPYVKAICVKRGSMRYRVFLYMLKKDAIELIATKKKKDDVTQPSKPNKPEYNVNRHDNAKTENNDEHAEMIVEEEPTIAETEETSKPTIYNKFTDAVFVSDDVHRMLLQAGTLLELSKFMKQYKEEGKISEYQGAMSLNAIPSDSYKMVVDATNQKVMAILTPTNINIQTNEADDISNYHGCSVVWYK